MQFMGKKHLQKVNVIWAKSNCMRGGSAALQKERIRIIVNIKLPKIRIASTLFLKIMD